MKTNNSLDYTFKEGGYFPPAFKVMGAIMVLIGIGILTQLNFVGIIVMVVGLVPIVAQKGIDINFDSKMYREPFMLFGVHIGSWNKLPAIEYVSMFTATKSQTMTFVSMSGSSKWKEIEVNLIYPRNQRLNVLITVDYDKALQLARRCEKHLDVEIYDATGEEKVWLERLKS